MASKNVELVKGGRRMSPANKAYFMSYTKLELVQYIERLINEIKEEEEWIWPR